MSYQKIILATLAIIVVLLMSCANSHEADSPSATLVNIVIDSRSVDSSETGEFELTQQSFTFHPESTSYSLTIDSLSILGIKPVASSSESSILVTLDGKMLTAKEWNETDSFYTCRYEPGKDTRTIEILVTSEDGTNNHQYTIQVHFDRTYLSGIILYSKLSSSDESERRELPITPVFYPESTFYSVTLNAFSELICLPMIDSAISNCSVTLDGNKLTGQESFMDTMYMYTSTYEPGKDTRTIEILVSSKNGACERKYTITAHFDTVCLSSLPMVSRGSASDGYKGYSALSPTLAFHPESTSYSVSLDALSEFGCNPTTFSKLKCSVTLDGNELTAVPWNDTDSFFSCTYEPGRDVRKFEIHVTPEAEAEERVYTINVFFDTIPDFAPLTVGNVWVYDVFLHRTIYNAGIWKSIADTLTATMECKSSYRNKDTLFYCFHNRFTGFSVLDSNNTITATSVDTFTLDTLCEIGETITCKNPWYFQDGYTKWDLRAPVFSKHTVTDNESTGSLDKDDDGKYRYVISVDLFMAQQSELIFTQETGLTFFKNSAQAHGSGNSEKYLLRSFTKK